MAVLDPNDAWQDRGVIKVTDGTNVLEINSDGSLKTTRDTDLEGGGIISVGTTAVEVTFTAVPNSIIISAANDNIGTLYIGKSDVTTVGANAINYLDAGEKMVLTYNDTDNPIYVVADQAAQNFFKGALF
jgi:hypothetical protein